MVALVHDKLLDASSSESAYQTFVDNLLSLCCLQEVIIVEDDNGQIVRETLKDNDGLMQYRTMRETLIYLSHLDYEDTEYQMLEKLRSQMGGSWTWDALNTLCWAIGSISGSMHVSCVWAGESHHG